MNKANGCPSLFLFPMANCPVTIYKDMRMGYTTACQPSVCMREGYSNWFVCLSVCMLPLLLTACPFCTTFAGYNNSTKVPNLWRNSYMQALPYWPEKSKCLFVYTTKLYTLVYYACASLAALTTCLSMKLPACSLVLRRLHQ